MFGVNFLRRQVTTSQNTVQWTKAREKYITATNVSYGLFNKDWMSKKFGSVVENNAMRRGTLLEPISKKIFSKIYKVKIYECGLIRHTNPSINLAASPDGYFFPKYKGKSLNTPSLIEIKNPYTRPITHLVPYNYWIQMQIQMIVCNLFNCIYFETAIGFKQEFSQEDKKKYEHWGRCSGELIEYGNFWYLENYFYENVERDDKWIKNNWETILSFCNQLRNKNNPYNLRSRKNRKRTFSEMQETDLQKFFYYNENSMHNYLNNDTLSDFLDMYANNDNRFVKEMASFNKAVANYNKICAGDLRYNLIDNYKQYDIVTIPYATSYNLDINLHKMTLDYMKKGIDIIVNPILISEQEQMYVNTFAFIKGSVLLEETEIDDIQEDVYYPYIFKKKRLKVFGDNIETLTNHRDMKEIRCSALFHCMMINKFQDVQIDKVFIVGYGYEVSGKKIDINLDNELFTNQIHIVKMSDEQVLLEKCNKAFMWLDLCKKFGSRWDVLNLVETVPVNYRRYLLPNVCNVNRWSIVKKDLAEKYNDVGMFWGIGPQKRQHLHLVEKIFSWKDPRFLTYIDNTFHKNKEMMKHMVEMSKNPNAPPIFLPNGKIQNLINDWNLIGRLEFYVDFETINKSVSDTEIIYLIGMVVRLPNGHFFYKPYILNEICHGEEAIMIERWVKDMNELKNKYNCDYTPNLFCWGNAETQMINSLKQRMEKLDKQLPEYPEFIDMCKIFKEEPILVKGCKEGFSLKNILNKMTKYGLIEEVKYEDEFCNRGDISIVKALEYYKTKDPMNQVKLVKYNEVDCIALMKIIDKVREFC